MFSQLIKVNLEFSIYSLRIKKIETFETAQIFMHNWYSKSIHNRGGAAASPIAAKPRLAIAVDASAPKADGFYGAEGLSPRKRRGRAEGERKAAAAAVIYCMAKPPRRSLISLFF